MSNRKVDFRPLLILINLALGFCVLFLSYLLFGGMLRTAFESKPLAVQTRSKEIGTNNIGDDDQVIDGIHVQTGLVFAEGFEIVRATCTACHSAQLVTQNSATREGWLQMIRWMQKTQGLWDLGKNEKPIVDYLAKHYAPEEVGRRANLDIAAIEWYILELEE